MSSREEGLRILIEIDSRQPELAPLQDLPWETLYDPKKGDFLTLDRKTPVVRCLRVPRKRQTAPLQEKRLRILALSASPFGCPPLDLERERRNLKEAWKGPIVPLQKTDREEIHQIFRKAPVHVLHFMGHGSFDRATGEGMLLLEGKNGVALPVSGRALAEDLKRFPDLRLVVLNACQTACSVGEAGPDPFAGVATALVMGGAPAVIAMRQPVTDAAAVAFSKALYERLAAGDPVEAALTEARLAIHRLDEKSGEWATPVLFLRPTREGLPTWLRKLLAASLAAAVILAILALYFGLSWERERRSTEVNRLINEGTGLLEDGRAEEARSTFL
ncbi:MAG TPA: CHAT domain-containing protein, partial [Thermoanaerobaculia bacterium]|nr:CHAT domain-containing protein [Thermoanaerobaculia bacterium]